MGDNPKYSVNELVVIKMAYRPENQRFVGLVVRIVNILDLSRWPEVNSRGYGERWFYETTNVDIPGYWEERQLDPYIPPPKSQWYDGIFVPDALKTIKEKNHEASSGSGIT